MVDPLSVGDSFKITSAERREEVGLTRRVMGVKVENDNRHPMKPLYRPFDPHHLLDFGQRDLLVLHSTEATAIAKTSLETQWRGQ
jgi:hypothetical protein